MNKSIIGLVVFLGLAGAITLAVINNGNTDTVESTNENPDSLAETAIDQSAQPAENQDQTAQNDSSEAVLLTRSEVGVHNTADDCWTIIEGNVYDITPYLSRHPGGSVISQACGIDGTSLFTQRTTGDGQTVGSGTPHSNGAQNQLGSFLLGQLED